MESKRTATTYFIPPGKFLLMENALGNPDLIQSSVSSDCRVTIVDSANFPLDELEQWPTFRLTSADIKLKLGDGAYYIYIVVPTPDNTESTSAFISYNTALVDREGYQVIETEDEEGNPKLEKGELLGKSGFKYYQCGVISARGGNASAITAPAGQGRLLSVDLGVNPQDANLDKKVDWDFFYSLFKPHYDDPKDPTKLTWIEAKSHMGIQGGVTMSIEGEGMDLPTIYDGLPIDWDTLYWVLDENGKKLYLKAKGGEGNGSFGEIETLGEGNAITKVDVIDGGEGEADKLVFTKEKTFIDKELLEKDYLTKAYIEENYYTKKTTDETFFKKDDAKGLFVTLDETTQEILGVKTFKNGLNIGSSKIWQSQSDVVYVDANLVVRGGVTMYGLNKVDVPTIMAGVAVDDVTISKKNGYLEVIGGGGGSIEYPLSWSGFSSGSYDGTSAKTIYIPSKLSELTDDLSKYLPLTGGTLTGNLTVNGVFNAKGTKVYMPTGSDGRGFAFAGQYMYVHWDYSSWERIFHLDGNNRIVLPLIPQITGVGLLADRPWVGQNYVSELGLAQDSSGTFNQYLTYTKNGVVNKISVGYAGYATGLKAWSTSDLSSSGVWNTVIGMRTAFFASNASNIPVAAGTNANGLITFMPVYNYGFQLAYLNQLSTGYESIPHLYFRNYVNGSYKGWYRIVTNGPQMAFEGVNWDNPYMRMRYQSGDWYYVQMRSDGMWLGLSNTKGVNINSEGRLYTTGHISVGSVYTRGNIVLSDHSIYFKSSVSSGSSNWRIVGYGSGLQFNYASYTTDPETATYTGILQLNSTKITAKTDLVCTGGITMYGTSDQRLKQNIRSFSASEELMKLGGVYQFEYVEEEVKRNYKYKGTHFGLIYQNVKESSLSKMCMEREDGFGALNYLDTSFISLLAAVGMEHETRLQRLERENRELRMEVEQLKNK